MTSNHVGDSATKENLPVREKKGRLRYPPIVHKKYPLILIIRGRRWSPSIYWNARMSGYSTERAWVEAFVQ